MALTKATFSMIKGAVLNVQDYGAVGDGTTDDSSAIQAALDVAAGSKVSGIGQNANVVYIPATDSGYRIATGLTVAVGVVVVGDGTSSIIKADSGVVAFDISGGTDQIIRGLHIQASGSGSIGIQADTVTRPIIEDVFIVGPEYGVKGSKTLYPVLRDCYFSATVKGIELSAGAGTWNQEWFNNVITLDQVRCTGSISTTTGIDITGMGVLMTNCDTSHNLIGTKIQGTATSSVNRSQTCTIINQYNEDTDTPFKFVNCRQVTVISAYNQGKATGSAATAIYDLDYTNLYVISNTQLDYFEYAVVAVTNSVARFQTPATYYVDTAFQSVDSTSNVYVPANVTVAQAAPTTGYWDKGDVVWNSLVAAGGSPGWVCTTAGNPGTWKAMANVAA